MTVAMRSRAQTLALVLGVGVAALPIAFGAIRAATTGTDFRYLWTALAALAGSAAVMAGGRAGNGVNVPRMLLALCVGTLLAALTAFLVGARSPGAVLVVSLAFGACAAIGGGLVARSRVQTAGGAGD